MESIDAANFDEAYYERYYFDKKTRVADPRHMERLGNFVCAYLKYLRVPVQRVLDVGCGIGLWRDIIARHFPQASFHGVEVSQYLCERYGWERGSVVDYRAREPFDLVICQGVLAYLSPADLKLALRNLGELCSGALYLEVVAREDYEQDIVDDTLTDPHLFRHRAEVYRRGLAGSFKQMGGGLWLSRQADVPVFALESAEP
ncbi:class I SAM-dependent methyltransferase [Variovorax dokdonensis]|uniref:Class I SAM-dependent methyltransferase n=1 Tax=Variovorax dokdonensis TaxID=344883 RepID=A0ABT7N7G7_9BURK|nr:class I SAM-dependent methyltransferase [Variovorax dokdonensis]MDM0043886.1 class I SAM-dependent methyltransferase [Variovorax dokdonensis]